MAKSQNATEPPNRDAVSEKQAAESGNEEKESPTMISSTTDQKDGGGGGDDVAMNELGLLDGLDGLDEEECDDISFNIPFDPLIFNLGPINEEENEEPSQTETAATSSKKRKQVAAHVSMDSSPNITPKKRKEGPSLTSSAETPTKRRRGRPPGSGSGSGSNKRKEGPSETTSFGISGGNFTPRVIELNDGQDVVDVLYSISVANRRKTVTILSASGSVSDIVDLTPDGSSCLEGKFEMHSMAIKCLVDDHGRHCRKKAMCTITCIDDQGNLFANTSVNSLKVAGRVNIVAALFDKDTAKETGARIVELGDGPRNDEKNPIAAATPHQMIDPASEDSRKVMKEEGCTSGFLPTTPTVGDGNIISPTSATTTSASNDKNMKSPSVGDTCN